MNPVEHRRMMAQQRDPAPTMRSRPMRNDVPRPGWNNLQQDHTKYRLTPRELMLRRESRKPRPLNSEPLLGDRHFGVEKSVEGLALTAIDMHPSAVRASSAGSPIQHSAHSSGASPTNHTYTEYEIDLKTQSPTLKARPTSASFEQLTVAGPDKVPTVVYQKRDCEHIELFQTLLQKVNRLTDTVFNLGSQISDLTKEVDQLRQDNADKAQTITDLKRAVGLQRELSNVNEYVAMEEVLERLKFL